MRVAIPESIKRAKLIIAISEATRQEVIATFNLPSERVQTVLLGVDAIYQPRSAEIVQPVLDQFGLRYGEFSFFVSTIEPRKNLRNLIAAYGQMPLELRMRYPLVLVGGRGWQSEDIHADIQKASHEGWLKYLGFVEQSCLPMLYAGCRLFTYPSWYEGFGLPIAEAMASGVPVLTANNSSMPEVAAGAALLVDPANVDDIAQQLQQGLTDTSWREQAIARGLQRAAELSWDACVENTVKAYQSIYPKR
jgi:alpha-1,3-rhamnosyl/mannosyltransferase